MFDTLTTSVGHNVRPLFDYSGRDTRALFWPWVGVVYAVVSVTQAFA